MKVRLNKSVRVPVPAGSVVDLPDSQAILLIKVGTAVRYEESKSVERAVKAPEEKAAKKASAKKTKKKE